MHRLIQLLTSCKRVYPDFIIIGAQKAGTTSLYDYLCQHPQIHAAGKKEIHYFDTRFYRGQFWYKSYFPFKGEIKEGEITGEASPAYLADPNCAERISSVLPNIKLIALLRNPVKRAISSYFHQIRGGRETLSIEEALEQEETRTAGAKELLLKKKWFVEGISRQFRRYSYRERGVYVNQLKEYFQHFDRSQIFIESSETFFKNTEHTLENIFEFLNVDPGFVPSNLSVKRKTDYKRHDEVPEHIIRELTEYYAPFNQELYKLLDRDFGWE